MLVYFVLKSKQRVSKRFSFFFLRSNIRVLLNKLLDLIKILVKRLGFAIFVEEVIALRPWISLV